MRSFFIRLMPVVMLAALFSGTGMAHAAPWMFNQSYYSHTPAVQATAPVDPRIIGGPYFSSPQGSYVRGSWRISRTMINVRGRAVDQTWNWESWVQGGSQY